jgi:hypothetical protein
VRSFGKPLVPITAERLLASIESSGGFTIRRRTGAFREHGVCVATRPHAELSFHRSEWTNEMVDGWIAALANEPRWRASHIGGWEDPMSGQVVLDVVRVIPCRLKRLAFVIGRLTKQDYAFNLSDQEVMVLA